MIPCPEVGQLVVVRKRPFVVTEIVPPATGGSKPNHLLKLSSVEDDGMGEEMEVIWELEPGTSVHEKSTLPIPTAFDDPKKRKRSWTLFGGVPFPNQTTESFIHLSAVV